eukprot:7300482-Heterocapsa_arctica.AAC.1
MAQTHRASYITSSQTRTTPFDAELGKILFEGIMGDAVEWPVIPELGIDQSRLYSLLSQPEGLAEQKNQPDSQPASQRERKRERERGMER